MHLSDYKVRVIDEQDQTAAKVRVLIESKNFTDTWSTVGVSSNVIEASWEALVDSMRYALLNQLSLDNENSVSSEPRGLVNH
ncbi:putative alpha-isopropylmalate/homocitrate synthase family transferase [compost metagenome]